MADVITRLKLESGEYDSKIKRATQGLLQMEQECRKVGGTLAYLEKDQKQFIQSLGQMQTVSTSVRGKIGELTAAYTDLRSQYNRLTDEEKKGDFGRALSASLDQLRQRTIDAKRELSGIQQQMSGSKFGQLGSVIDGIGQKMGLNANITELLTSKSALLYAGIGAGVAAVTKATSAWMSYNAELARQDQVTTVTTGLKGAEADRMTDKLRALSDTYKVDFREAVSAANVFMTQFGKTGDEAVQLIKDGMQGMIQGDGPKLLQMIQQYAPSFRDAGIAADQLVAIIHNSEGGIFTDQNMNAIVMGIKNIRLMTKQTSEALGKLGIDGEEMTRKLNDGSMTIFQALGQVSQAIERTGSGSQAAGEVMQYVFGRQGAVAGTKLGEAIANLNLNLEETKKQTGELGEAFSDLQDANERLNTAIRDAFSYDGWEQMVTGIKTKLISALSVVIEKLGDIRRLVFGLNDKDILRGMNGEGNGQPTKVDQQIEILKNAEGFTRFSIYRGQIAQYRQAINELKEMANAREKVQKGGASDADRKLAAQAWEKYKTTDYTLLRQMAEGASAMMQQYIQRAAEETKRVDTEKPEKNLITTPTTTTTTGTTSSQQAQKKIDDAQHVYQQALEQAALELKAGTITEADAKKKELTAQESLWKAIGDARHIYDAEGYKEAQDAAAQRVMELGGDTKKLADAQKAAEQRYKEVAAQTKKLTDAQEELSKAISSNDLKAYYAANKKAVAAGGQADTATAFTLTEGNATAFIADLKEQIAKADIGSDLYNSLTSQLKDASALASVMQRAVNAGIQDLGFDPQQLWTQIFTENGNIPNETWRTLLASINEKLREGGFEPIKLTATLDYTEDEDDSNTGKGKKKGKSKRQQDKDTDDKNSIKVENQSLQELQKLTGGMGSLVSGLQQMGVEIPQGIQSAIGILQGITTILTAIQTISAISAIPFLHNGGVLHAATGTIVPGTRFSGDQIPAMLDAGEVVLNRAQAGVVASELQGGGAQNIHISGELSGEKIYLAVNRALRRQGKGELVTWG